MRFTPTPIAGAFLIEPEPVADERGFFARTFCREEFLAHGLNPNLVQCSISFNRQKGTVRGMHYQAKPHEEAKMVRCTQGAIHDVLVDIRRDSPSFGQWCELTLTAENRHAVYIPEGVAHGFQTMTDNAEVLYQMAELFHPECASGFCWNDPAFGIVWPEKISIISARDRDYPKFLG